MKPTLFIMVKEPHPGRVKTRLGRGIGMVAAAWWFRHQTRRLIQELGSDPRWNTVLAVSPDAEGLTSRVWPADVSRWAQGHGDLGDRMKTIFRSALKGPIVIVGADIPGIKKPHISKAFKLLGQHESVYGPAPDGGYWLIGMRRQRGVPASVFAGVRWSSKDALQDTIKTIPARSIGYLETLQDIDTIDDLKKLKP